MNLADVSKMRWLLSALLIAGAALFTIGVTIERNIEDDHTEATEQTEPGEASERESHSEEGEEETVLGLNLESPLLVALGIAVSLALAVGAWRSNARVVLIAAGAFAAAFAALDIAEAAHQADESRVGLVVLAALVALVHLTAVVVAVQRLRVRTALAKASG